MVRCQEPENRLNFPSLPPFLSPSTNLWRPIPLITLLALLPGSPLQGAPVNFARDIRPILGKCTACHGQAEQGGLRLDSRNSLLQGSFSGPVVVPGQAEKSQLIKMVTTGNDQGMRMPLDQPPLEASQVELLRRWIDQEMPWPADASLLEHADPYPKHWSFHPAKREELPTVGLTDWPRNPIDYFVLEKQEAQGLLPSPEANRTTLLRRVSLDVVGLPPTIAEVQEFLLDSSPDAYERVVERLLASPHFGERWGRHWLDVARYADSDGYENDGPRSIWKYRDWVIAALNNDIPFRDFVLQQIAGDLLPDATASEKTATGFIRCSKGGSTPGKRPPIDLIDRVNTVGRVFLGLTIGCAQCHNHKFDPISQREYYELFAFFNSSDDQTLDFATPEEIANRAAYRAETESMKNELKEYELLLAERFSKTPKALAKLDQPQQQQTLKEILALDPKKIDAAQNQFIRMTFSKLDEEHKKRCERIKLHEKATPTPVSTLVMRELPTDQDTHIFIRGDPTQQGPRVKPNVPKCLPPLEATGPPNRLDLATWLSSPQHPLAARVTVNRIWQQYFGTGLVETADDFGENGAIPSHPQLLEWLACELTQTDGSMKSLHRKIVTSATYRQASHNRPDLQELDPQNRLLARQSRLRLEAEIIRDQGLAASGLLNLTIGGPSVFPYQIDGIMQGRADRSVWKMDSGKSRFRRGMYVHFWRLTPHPFLHTFDIPDANESCTRRMRSNTPLQALALLNDPWFTEFAVALADRTLRETPGADDTQKAAHAFRLCLARSPKPTELKVLTELASRQRKSFQAEPQRTKELLNSTNLAMSHSNLELATWTAVSRTLLNLDEFINRE